MSAGAAIRAGRAFIELGLRDKVAPGLKRVQARLNAFANGISAMGRGLLGASAAVLGPLAGAVKLFMGMGDQMEKMSHRTGVTVEALSELSYAAKQSGASAETLESGIRNMSRFMLNAERGSAAAVDTFKDLGLSLSDLQGLTPDEQFMKLADAVAHVDDPTRRAALAMQVFGKSGTQLLPLFANGADGIEALRKRARDLGLVMSGEDASAAVVLGDLLADLWAIIQMGVFNIGAALAGPLTELAAWLISVVVPVSAWIKENHELVVTIAKIAAIVAGVGAALLALAAAIQLVAFAFGALATAATAAAAVIGFLMSPIGLIIAGVGLLVAGLAGLTAWFLTSTAAGQQLAGYLMSSFQALASFVGKVFGGITDALMAGDWKLAATVLMAGLRVAFIKGINFLRGLWDGFKNWFLNLFDQMLAWVLSKVQQIQQSLGVQVFDVSGLIGGAEGRVANREELRKKAAAEGEKDLERAIYELDATIAAAAAARERGKPAPSDTAGATPTFDPEEFLASVPETVGGLAFSQTGTFSATAAARIGGRSDLEERRTVAAEAMLTTAKEGLKLLRAFGIVR